MLEPHTQIVHADPLAPKQPLTGEGSALETRVTAHTALLLLKRDCGEKVLQTLHQKFAPYLQTKRRFKSCFLFVSNEKREAVLVTLWNEANGGPEFSTISRALRAFEPVTEGIPWTQRSRISEMAVQKFRELTSGSAPESANANIAVCNVSKPLLERIKALSSGILSFHEVRM